MRRGLAGAIVAAAAVLATAVASPAAADTIGGELLASPHRTVSLQAGAQPLPDVWAEAWIIADAETREVMA